MTTEMVMKIAAIVATSAITLLMIALVVGLWAAAIQLYKS